MPGIAWLKTLNEYLMGNGKHTDLSRIRNVSPLWQTHYYQEDLFWKVAWLASLKSDWRMQAFVVKNK